MALSPILGIPLLTTSQNNKEVTINDAISFLEKANNASQTLSFAAGDVTLATLDIQRFFLFKVTGATAARNLNVPSATKIFAVDNSQNAYPLTVVRGSSTLTLAATTVGMIYIDGTRLVFLWYSANGGSIPFTFLSDAPHDYAGKAGQFLRVNLTATGIDFAAAGAAISDFLDLTDTPDSYTGKAGNLVRVNAAATGLEFLNKLDFTALNGVPTTFTDAGGYYVRVKGDETGLEFVLAGAADSFLGLSDTPDDYAGKAGNMVIVNPTANALAFVPIPSWAINFLGFPDTPDTYTGATGYYVRVNADGTGLEFAAVGDSISDFLDLNDVPVNYTGAGGFNVRVKTDETGLEFHLPEGGSADYPPFPGNAGKALIVNATEDGVAWGDAPGGGIGDDISHANIIGAFQTLMGPAAANSTDAFAIKGNLIVTTDRLQVLGASVTITGGAGATYKLVVASFNTTTNQLIAILGSSAALVVADLKTPFFKLTEAVTVPANTGLAVLIVRTDAGPTGACQVPFAAAPGFAGPGFTFFGSSRYAGADPAVGDVALFNDDTSVAINLFHFTDDGLVDLGSTLPSGGTAGQVLTKASTADGDAAWVDLPTAALIVINTQTANYALLPGDDKKYVRMNVASANTLTVPPNAAVPFAIGTQIPVRQAGAGQTTVVAGSGVTINAADTLKLRKQGSTAALVKVGTDEWDLTGDLI
jgi:hypothetical protein